MKIILIDEFKPSLFIQNNSQLSFESISEDEAKTFLSLADTIINRIQSANSKELFLSIRLGRRLEDQNKIIDLSDTIILLAEFDIPWVLTLTEILDKKITWWKIVYVEDNS